MAQKECNATRYWIELLNHTSCLDKSEYNNHKALSFNLMMFSVKYY
ncbi:hypothetical protein [Robertkochia aurantiaca]